MALATRSVMLQEKIWDRSKPQDRHPHLFRHTYAHMMLAAGTQGGTDVARRLAEPGDA